MVEIHRRQKPFMWMERSSKFGIVLMHPEWSVIGRAICTVRNGTKKSSFTLEFALTEPLSYIKFGNINLQVSNVPVVYIHKLAVLPEQQGQGLGTWCLEAIEKLAFRQGHYAVRLDAVKTHQKLLSFYESRGYQMVGELILNSDVWVDAFVFEKVLTEVNEYQKAKFE